MMLNITKEGREYLVILGVDLNCRAGEQQLHEVVVAAHLQPEI